MYQEMRLSAVIPARNEELNIAAVVAGLVALTGINGRPLFDDIVVCDNGSTDATAELARTAGATVVFQGRAGYGAACLTAIAALPATDIIVFIDGDNSVLHKQVHDLLDCFDEGADLVIGVRDKHRMEPGALSFPQLAGNWLATGIIRVLWRKHIADLGPFRAIRFSAYQLLSMQNKAFGWTAEMQVKAIQHGLATHEVPVVWRQRRGVSKISGSVLGIMKAAHGIMGTIFTLYLKEKLLQSGLNNNRIR